MISNRITGFFPMQFCSCFDKRVQVVGVPGRMNKQKVLLMLRMIHVDTHIEINIYLLLQRASLARLGNACLQKEAFVVERRIKSESKNSLRFPLRVFSQYAFCPCWRKGEICKPFFSPKKYLKFPRLLTTPREIFSLLLPLLPNWE